MPTWSARTRRFLPLLIVVMAGLHYAAFHWHWGLYHTANRQPLFLLAVTIGILVPLAVSFQDAGSVKGRALARYWRPLTVQLVATAGAAGLEALAEIARALRYMDVRSPVFQQILLGILSGCVHMLAIAVPLGIIATAVWLMIDDRRRCAGPGGLALRLAASFAAVEMVILLPQAGIPLYGLRSWFALAAGLFAVELWLHMFTRPSRIFA